jgi:Uma2 family endonuclease
MQTGQEHMKTLLKLGPADHDRPLNWEEFTSATFEEGYHYELIRGRLYVSPLPNLPQGYLERWADRKLTAYSDQRPDVINYVHPKARIFVPGEPEMTVPEPDLAAYHDFPLDQDMNELRWEDVSPVLVVEVLSEGDPDKDLVRNVDLYLQVTSIREYWIVDGRVDVYQPTLLVYRRRGQRWQKVIEVGPGETYTPRLLPDFTLVIDPRA